MYVVMSFKPVYAHEIVDGVKDCEVRTYFSPLSSGDVVLIYSSSPEKAFIGEFVISNVITGYSKDIALYLRSKCKMFDEINWRFFNERYALSRRRLILLEIGDVIRYRRSVSLYEVRRYVTTFRPPMSYVYVDYSFVKLIRSLSA